jgi:hypothetical protein
MGTRESSQSVGAGAGPASTGLDTAAVAGRFAYRFSGYAMPTARPYFLTGLGHFQIDPNGNLTGTHRSAIMPIQGQGAKLANGAYELTGTISIRSDRTGDASILFTKTEGGGLNVQGKFYVLVAENVDRLWMISSGAVVPETGAQAEELVTLEAVRVGS